MPQTSAEPTRKKRLIACNYCRLKRVKCNGCQPCERCERQGEECLYSEHQRKRSSKPKNDSTSRLEQRLEFFEQRLLQIAQEKHPGVWDAPSKQHGPIPGIPRYTPSAVAPPPPSEYQPRLSWQTMAEQTTNGPRTVSRSDISPVPVGPPSSSLLNTSGSTPDHQVIWNLPTIPFEISQKVLSPTWVSDGQPLVRAGEHEAGRESSYKSPDALHVSHSIPTIPLYSTGAQTEGVGVFSKTSNENDEIGSYLSICSKGGIKWATETSGGRSFETAADSLVSEKRRYLKLPKKPSSERVPEPDAATAWGYAQTYFEESPEIAFGVINRSDFESRLRLQFDKSKALVDDDPAWYALRNTVYAAGCRIQLSEVDYSSTFAQAHESSWPYFENALAVLSQLLHPRSDLSAIQAVTVMTFYTEGLDSASLDHELICTALRLAQCAGSSGRSIALKNISHIETALVRFVKNIRALEHDPNAEQQMIDDNLIMCPVPATAPNGNTMNVTFFTYCVRHAQILSGVVKKLTLRKLLKYSPDKLIDTLRQLSRRLEEWKDSLPAFAKPQKRTRRPDLPDSWDVWHAVYLQCAYYSAAIAIHSLLAHPWSADLLSPRPSASMAILRNESSTMVADASRNMILTANDLKINAASPSWQAITLPTVGAVNLFIHVLKYPTSPTAMSDVALLDVVAGHFGHLEYICSLDVSFSAVRELANIARAVVRAAAEKIDVF